MLSWTTAMRIIHEAWPDLLRDRYGNPSYLGPWAFPTLGSAGGQTVFGALTTGTDGGDFRQPPIADCVLAMQTVSAQMTPTSRAMTRTAHTGKYGSHRNWVMVDTTARPMPTIRPQTFPDMIAAPTATRARPITASLTRSGGASRARLTITTDVLKSTV